MKKKIIFSFILFILSLFCFSLKTSAYVFGSCNNVEVSTDSILNNIKTTTPSIDLTLYKNMIVSFEGNRNTTIDNMVCNTSHVYLLTDSQVNNLVITGTRLYDGKSVYSFSGIPNSYLSGYNINYYHTYLYDSYGVSNNYTFTFNGLNNNVGEMPISSTSNSNRLFTYTNFDIIGADTYSQYGNLYLNTIHDFDYTYDFYLDDVLIDTYGCLYDDLSVTDSGGISCIVHPENISANKIVARTHLSQTYLPNEWWYNNLSFNDVSNHYYNAIIGGFFPDNTILTDMSFINLHDSNVNYFTNLLDVQYTSLYRPNVDFRYNAFVVAFNFPDTITSLTNYDSMEYTVTFPTTSISYFQMWENGFNNLSNNYIQENIDLASNELQQEILNNLTGNSGPLDDFSDFFTDFDVNYHGLSSLITLPLTYLSNISSSSCSAITLPLPFLNSNIVLPCFSTYYSNFLGSLYNIIQFIIRGFIYYFIVLDSFNFIKKLHSPNNTSVEVIDL